MDNIVVPCFFDSQCILDTVTWGNASYYPFPFAVTLRNAFCAFSSLRIFSSFRDTSDPCSARSYIYIRQMITDYFSRPGRAIGLYVCVCLRVSELLNSLTFDLDIWSQLPRKGHSSPPLFGPCLLWPRSLISATDELLLYCTCCCAALDCSRYRSACAFCSFCIVLTRRRRRRRIYLSSFTKITITTKKIHWQVAREGIHPSMMAAYDKSYII